MRTGGSFVKGEKNSIVIYYNHQTGMIYYYDSNNEGKTLDSLIRSIVQQSGHSGTYSIRIEESA